MDIRQQMLIAQQQLADFDIPTIPAELIELQNLLQKTEFPDMHEVAGIIGRNTVLSGELIKVANQSQFLPKDSDSVTTIKGAIDSLGLKRLKNLVFGLGFKTQVADIIFDDLMDHSIDVANVATELSRWVDGVQQDEVYLAGLFHNAGAIVMEMKFGNYQSTFYNTLTNCYSGLTREVKNYKTHHGFYGLLVAKEWRLDSIYAQVMLMHHQRNLDAIKNKHVRTLVALIQLGNSIVSEVSFDSFLGSEVKEMLENAQHELYLEDDVIDEVRRALMSNSLV
ncbi:HDOD domain-containing protein [Hydrogenovibrio sp. 3SP14C1]|uniref:HDOD domain-containing protein n=1 Tax=Hydrogenovibrio sp. 3SP14C1 TaxID=3038774 RepID=UPI002417C8B6|nr:HDOD domain-containing protein [Hydrogenovibrio sp. 3SP14C1]MDG4812905.1 HDOD domain-containing protein [Hydrogenovibrio sp. 3SP14C1]